MRILAALILSFALGLSAASAQSWPTRTVRLIVPAAPAGITDLAARVLSERLATMWGVSVIVENRPGGGGTIGVMAARSMAADGYSLLVTTNGELTLQPVINSSTKYEAKDFVPLAMLTNNPILIVANTDTPYKTLADVVAQAKKDPSKLAYASPGPGTWNHLTGEWLWSAAGVKVLHVPYRGGGPAGTAVAAGDVPLGVVAISSALPHIQSGRMRVLAIATAARSKQDMSWPPIAETLIPGFDSLQWVGLYALAGTDPKIIEKISADVMTVMADPKVRERYESMGVDPMGLSAAEAAKQIELDIAIVKKVNAVANIRIE